MSQKNAEEINFQYFVGLVKQNKLSWNTFIDVLQDLSNSDLDRLKNLNAILLTELTMNYSNLDRMKYLNGILLFQFKNHIEKESSFEVTQNEVCEKSIEFPEESDNEEIKDDLTFSPKEDSIMEINPIDNNSKTVESNLNEERADEFEDNLTSLLKEEVTKIIPSETDAKTFLCHICNKEYNIHFHLNQHMRKVHKENKSKNVQIDFNNDQKLDDQQIATNENDNSISNTNDLMEQDHVIQAGQKEHKCNFCDESFSQEGSLDMHIRLIHEDDKDYKCKSCSKSFLHATSLKRHILKVHEGYKDYTCEPCEKSFSLSKHLKGHIHIIQEGHKDYKCVFCDKSFSQSKHLKSHIHTDHEGQKDYKCESCGKSFFKAGNLKQHIHTVHERHKDYKYDFCVK